MWTTTCVLWMQGKLLRGKAANQANLDNSAALNDPASCRYEVVFWFLRLPKITAITRPVSLLVLWFAKKFLARQTMVRPQRQTKW